MKKKYTLQDYKEVRNTLDLVNQGIISAFTTDDRWNQRVNYQLSNGWVIEVFYDCEDWDYIENIKFPDGSKYDYDTMDYLNEKLYKKFEIGKFEPVEKMWKCISKP